MCFDQEIGAETASDWLEHKSAKLGDGSANIQPIAARGQARLFRNRSCVSGLFDRLFLASLSNSFSWLDDVGVFISKSHVGYSCWE